MNRVEIKALLTDFKEELQKEFKIQQEKIRDDLTKEIKESNDYIKKELSDLKATIKTKTVEN